MEIAVVLMYICHEDLYFFQNSTNMVFVRIVFFKHEESLFQTDSMFVKNIKGHF